MARSLHLNLNLLSSGRHDAAWKRAADPRAMLDIASYCRLAEIAERGRFDAVFFADNPALDEKAASRPWHCLEPALVAAAISQATAHIGLIVTGSAVFGDPYSLARRVATLDHISRGRAAWNVVTSSRHETQANFGPGAGLQQDERYRRVEEFIEVVTRLWDSFEDEALVADAAQGRYLDLERVHAAGHAGRYYSVAGPLNVPRTPQGRPVIVQAGASAASREIGARRADAFFTVQRSMEEARLFYGDIKARAARHGRRGDELLVLPGLYVVAADTEAAAWARKRALDELLDLEEGRRKLAARFNLDPAQLELDRPLPYDAILSFSAQSNHAFLAEILRDARSRNLTVRELLGLNSLSGHRVLVGSPEQIADDMELWFRSGAADGFNLNIDLLPDGLEAFVDHVVPELQRRGLFRREYEGATLRSHLGLTVPVNGYADA